MIKNGSMGGGKPILGAARAAAQGWPEITIRPIGPIWQFQQRAHSNNRCPGG